jgi:hypothetical protein
VETYISAPMNPAETQKYLDAIKPHREYWKNKNKYYYAGLTSLIDFLVPMGKKVFRVPFGTLSLDKETIPHLESHYDYIVASDALGYVDDVQKFLEQTSKLIPENGRIVLTQYNHIWEPILTLASQLKLRMPSIQQNWLSMADLLNLAHLSGLETVKYGRKMLFPKYIPLFSAFMNKIVVNIWPFSRLGLLHYVILRKPAPVPSMIRSPQPSLSIIVPARNEAGTIEKIVESLPQLGSFTEIVLIEGNSTDNTWEEIQRVAQVYKGKRKILIGRQDGKGKGDAVRKGFDMATGDVLAIYDADMTVPAHELAGFYYALVTHKGDFINGSRLVYPLEKESMRILNFFANKFFSFAFSALLGQPLKDTLCGTKVLWRKDYETIKSGRSFFGDFDPFGDFDLLFGAAKLNLKIVDMPVHYKQRVYGTTNISRWKHGWLLLRMTVFAARKLKFR